ncbi:MAG: phosphoribosyltransferase family protein [Mucinivorans sp.]
MANVILHGREFEPYISSEQVGRASQLLAPSIDMCYADVAQTPLFLVVLSGGMHFGSTLSRKLQTPVEYAFIKCRSYKGLCSTGKVSIEAYLGSPIKGRDVLVVDDVVDTGMTYDSLREYLLGQGARSVRLATMCFKPTVFKGVNRPDFVALEIDDIFIVGYGLDYNQLGRNIDGIYKLKP